MKDSNPTYSVVVPFYNEEFSLRPLYERIVKVMEKLNAPFEMVFVDDGSKDKTAAGLESIAEIDSRVVIVELRRNYGQTAALKAGFDHTSGEIIISMDGDLQHAPEEIPVFPEKNRGRIRHRQRVARGTAGSLFDSTAPQSNRQLDDGQTLTHRIA